MKKKSNKGLVIFLVLFILLFAAACVVIVLGKQKMDNYEQKVTELESQLTNITQFVYVASKDLKAGEMLEEGVNVMVQEMVTALPGDLYITAEDMGKIMTVSISAQSPIFKSMVTDEVFDKDTREVEIGVANLMLDQEQYDYVDLRIMFPDSSDYIIASKLKIKSIDLDNNIFYTNLDEDEIITLASATIDAFTVTGAKIYLTRYVESNLQEDAIPNYPVRQETMLLMATDPNILKRAEATLNAEARQALEVRLAAMTPEQLSAIAGGHQIVDTAHGNAFTNANASEVDVYAPTQPGTEDGSQLPPLEE